MIEKKFSDPVSKYLNELELIRTKKNSQLRVFLVIYFEFLFDFKTVS